MQPSNKRQDIQTNSKSVSAHRKNLSLLFSWTATIGGEEKQQQVAC
jgi:hypothetical protein